MKRKSIALRVAGYTVLEVMVTLAIAGILLSALGLAVQMSDQAVRKATGSHDSSLLLKKAARRIRQDLLQTSKQTLQIAAFNGPTGVAEGQALCVLTSRSDQGIDQVSTAGGPTWLYNVIYYCITPTQHDSFAGQSCTQSLGSWGIDDRCAHKVLIRKEIDLPSSSPPDSEPLLSASQLTNEIVAPVRLDVSGIRSGANCRKVEIIGIQMLGMSVEQTNQGLHVRLATVDVPRATKEKGIGSSSLLNSSYTQSYDFTVNPEMP
jgi:prepilin-type N-terminal cleavage/methylation domain-containing protein